MGDHFPLCEQYISGDGLPCICELLSEHADEMQAATRADIHAKLMAEAEVARLAPNGKHPKIAFMTHAAALWYAAKLIDRSGDE